MLTSARLAAELFERETRLAGQRVRGRHHEHVLLSCLEGFGVELPSDAGLWLDEQEQTESFMEALMTRWNEIADALDPGTSEAIARADSPGQGLAMLFASPAFLRR